MSADSRGEASNGHVAPTHGVWVKHICWMKFTPSHCALRPHNYCCPRLLSTLLLHHSQYTVMSSNLYEITGDVTTSDVKPASQMRQCKAVIHWADVCDPITRVNYNTSLQT